MSQIFMVGEQRSGSNLLRLILNQSSDISAPHPPHILQRMMPLASLYGELRDEHRFMQLVNDVCQLVELNPVAWDGVRLDRETIRARCRERSLVAIYGAVMDTHAEAHGARSWMCKSMQNIRWSYDLNAYFESPKYLFLYRDPRDVCLSFSKAVIGEKHPYFIAKQWAQLQQLCLRERDRLEPEQFYSLCYEELIADPDSVVKGLCRFLNIEFKQEMLAFHRSTEANRTAVSSDLWANVSQPIMKSNSRKFINELKPEDIRIVESVAGPVMDALGYDRVCVAPGEECRFSNRDITRFQNENIALKKAKAQATDPEDLRRRREQDRLLECFERRQRQILIAEHGIGMLCEEDVEQQGRALAG